MSEISFVKVQNATSLIINVNEVKRYLRIHGSTAVIEDLIGTATEEVYKSASLNAVFSKTKVFVEDDEICFDFDKVKSKDLAKNLYGCKEAYVFCATLGVEIDRLIKRYSEIEPSKAVVIDSVASALIEGFCDYINSLLAKDSNLCPRFSCGYGDFNIMHQASIIKALDANKRLGVFLTDSYMMTPFKTVTAIIGMK